MFHLLELYRSENKVAGGNLVSERFTYLTDTERNLSAGGALNVQKVDVFALSGFGAQINLIFCVLNNPARGFKHHVELTNGRPVVFAANGAVYMVFFYILFHFFVGHHVGIDRAVRVRFDELIGAVTTFAFLAVHFRIGERRGVSACFPNP